MPIDWLNFALSRGITLRPMDDEPTTYGQRLQMAMDLAKLPRPQARARLAGELEITVQALGKVLNGQSRSLTAENHMTAARFLRVDPWWLATGEGEARPSGLSTEALDVAEVYDRMNEDERKRFWLLLHVSRSPVPDSEVEKHLPPAPGSDKSRLSKSRA